MKKTKLPTLSVAALSYGLRRERLASGSQGNHVTNTPEVV